MRCFVALDLPPPVRNHIANVGAPLRDKYDLKWVARDQLHATLVFAGELAEPDVDELADAVERLDVPPLSLFLSGFGAFPQKGLPRVVWAGLGGDVEALSAVRATLAEHAEALGVPRDKRRFTPHVTVGRVKSPFGTLALLDELQVRGRELKPKPFSPPAITLYASTLTPRGPRHEVVARRPLSRGRG